MGDPRAPHSEDGDRYGRGHTAQLWLGGHRDRRLPAAYEARDAAEANGWAARRAWVEDVQSGSVRAVPGSSGAGYPRLAALSAEAVLASWTHREGEAVQARLSRVRIGRRP